MINTEPKFITPSDFYNYWGLDLNSALKSDNNVSNKANTFLKIVEDRVMSWIDSNSFRNTDWDDVWKYDHMLECLQKALLTQAMYVYRNSDIALDSGYDPDTGFVAKKEDIQAVVICEATLNYLREGGLFNQNIAAVRRGLKIR